jgi:glycosyltransferase involved in cell wall biosynthesis
VKTVFFNPTGILGGAELCLLDVLSALGEARPAWQASVLLGDDGPLQAAIEALGVPSRVLPLPGHVAELGDAGLGLGGGAGRLRLLGRAPAAALAATGYLMRLRTCLRALAPARVVTTGMKAHVLGAWAAPRGVPVVWHLHDYSGSRPVMARLLKMSSSRRAVSAVAVSHSVAEDAARVLGPGVLIRTIHNAVDVDRFSPTGTVADLDAAAGLPAAPRGTVRVGLVATFARWKGHEVFLDAAARIPDERPCRFYIVGGPIYRSNGSQYTLEELRTRAEVLGLGGRLGFTGHQTDPAAALRGLDVVVHASTRPEPFGRVIVEGMACGRAVVAMRNGGAAELFAHGVSALGCRPGDPAELAHAITRLLDDPELRTRLGGAGRETVLARFDRARLADQWLSVLEPRSPLHVPVAAGERT